MSRLIRTKIKFSSAAQDLDSEHDKGLADTIIKTLHSGFGGSPVNTMKRVTPDKYTIQFISVAGLSTDQLDRVAIVDTMRISEMHVVYPEMWKGCTHLKLDSPASPTSKSPDPLTNGLVCLYVDVWKYCAKRSEIKNPQYVSTAEHAPVAKKMKNLPVFPEDVTIVHAVLADLNSLSSSQGVQFNVKLAFNSERNVYEINVFGYESVAYSFWEYLVHKYWSKMDRITFDVENTVSKTTVTIFPSRFPCQEGTRLIPIKRANEWCYHPLDEFLNGKQTSNTNQNKRVRLGDT